MYVALVQSVFLYFTVYVLAFDDIFYYVEGQASQEMIEQGRNQYQLLKERGHLPQYGSCWKSAVSHVDDGCKHLSEETQSDIALHLTNCFLSMSGHQTYNCDLDRKPNLRGICINSMTDRAFNVYTEFYTHTQNICWFLRGQIWHETIAESAFRVGEQLTHSARYLDEVVRSQREAVTLQQKILERGQMLEGVLEQLTVSARVHQDVLNVMAVSMSGFHAWLIDEVSWFDSIVYYVVVVVLIVVGTSVKRTAGARLILCSMLFLNFLAERVFFRVFVAFIGSHLVYNSNSVIYSVVWFLRYLFVVLAAIYLIYHAWRYKDLMVENYKFLTTISRQNDKIIQILDKIKGNNYLDSFTMNSFVKNKVDDFVIKENEISHHTIIDSSISSSSNEDTFMIEKKLSSRNNNNNNNNNSSKIYNLLPRKVSLSSSPLRDLRYESCYNLRSKSRTPDVHV